MDTIRVNGVSIKRNGREDLVRDVEYTMDGGKVVAIELYDQHGYSETVDEGTAVWGELVYRDGTPSAK